MKIKYIREILIIFLVFYIGYSIFDRINIDKETVKKEEVYNETQKRNLERQEKSSTKIQKFSKEISSLNKKLYDVRSEKDVVINKAENKIKELKDLLKVKPKWRVQTVKEIKYVTLPYMELDLTIKEKNLCCELVKKWELTSNEWTMKYNSEVVAHDECKDLVFVLKKKKRVPMWTKIALGVLGVIVIIK